MSSANSTWSEHYWDDYPSCPSLASQVAGIVIFGESQVGKTCFLDQHLSGRPNTLYHYNRHLMRIDDELMNVEFMDLSSTTLRTAGPNFKSDLFIRKLSEAVGVVLLYDVTSLESFERVTNEAYMYLWMCKRYLGDDIGGKSCRCILVGNKVDLLKKEPQKRQVDRELAEQWAQSQGIKHFELTAREHGPVREAVHDLMRSVRKMKEREDPETRTTTAKEKQDKQTFKDRIKRALSKTKTKA